MGVRGLTVVDQNDQEVGLATDPLNGVVIRRVGDDTVVFLSTADGPLAGPLTFYHSKTDCTDDRYFAIAGGSGFAFSATVHRGVVFYTKTDPNAAPVVEIHAYEHFEANEDAALPGACLAIEGASPLGVVTAVADPVLANLKLPLKLK